jgi:hypothetical protein
MKSMKFKIRDEQHSREIQEALLAAGYGWGAGEAKHPQYTDAGVLYAGYFGGKEITYSHNLQDFEDMGNYNCEEHFLFNGQFVTKDYFTQPETPTKAEQQYCLGCSPLTCTGCEQVHGTIEEKLYAPLPLQPCNEWLRDRMKQIVEHILHALEQGKVVEEQLTREAHLLAVILNNSEEDCNV